MAFTFTEILAGYGAALSTVVFIWNSVRARPRVRVQLIFGMEGTGDDIKGGVYVFVQNPSSATVHISNISVLYPYTTTRWKDALIHMFRFRRLPSRLGWVHTSLSNYGLKDGCPVSIDPGKAHSVFLPEEMLDKMLKDSIRREIIGVAQDQLWNDTYSWKFRVPTFKSATDEKRT